MSGILLVILLVFLLGLILGLLWRSRRPPSPQPAPSFPQPPERHPAKFTEKALCSELGVRLAGAPADGSELDTPLGNRVIWVDGGDEVLVHLDSVKTRFVGRNVFVSVDLETDQTGRAPVIVAFALGDGEDNAGLVATTDEMPHGEPLLAARWGAAVRASVWNALLGVAVDHATERGEFAHGLFVSDNELRIQRGDALRMPKPEARVT